MDGNLATTSFEQLGQDLAQRRATGTLRITHGTDDVRVSWRDGVVVGAAGTTLDSRLGDRLVHSRLLSRDNLTAALATQAGSDKPLGALLIDDSLVNEHVVKVFVQEQILDALFWPLRWTTGEFTFTEEEVRTHRPSADMTFAQLLYALESRHRTWDEVTHTIPTTAAVPEFVPGADPSMASLEAGQNAVLAAVDGRRSMATIADDLGFSTYEVGVILHGLAVLGLVRLQKSEERTTEPSATEAPDAPVLTPPATAATAATEATEASVEVPTPRAEDSDVEEPAAFVLATDAEPALLAEQDEAMTSDFFGGGSRRDLLSAPAGDVAVDPAVPDPTATRPTTPEPVAAAPDLPTSSAPSSTHTDSFFDPTAADDDDLEVWTMDIGGGDDSPPAKPKPEPRAADPTPIAAPVTPTPDPVEPADDLGQEAPAKPPKPSGSGDVSDLLRELRQLSDD